MSDAGGGRRLLGQILKQQGKLKEGQVQEALSEQRSQGGLIGQHLVALGHCSAAHVAAALAERNAPAGKILSRFHVSDFDILTRLSELCREGLLRVVEASVSEPSALSTCTTKSNFDPALSFIPVNAHGSSGRSSGGTRCESGGSSSVLSSYGDQYGLPYPPVDLRPSRHTRSPDGSLV